MTTPTHTTAKGIYGALGYYENGPSKRRVWQKVREVSWLGLGSMQGWALAGPRMGAIHGCHAATSSVGAGPFFFKLVEPLLLTFFFPTLPSG